MLLSGTASNLMDPVGWYWVAQVFHKSDNPPVDGDDYRFVVYCLSKTLFLCEGLTLHWLTDVLFYEAVCLSTTSLLWFQGLRPKKQGFCGIKEKTGFL